MRPRASRRRRVQLELTGRVTSSTEGCETRLPPTGNEPGVCATPGEVLMNEFVLVAMPPWLQVIVFVIPLVYYLLGISRVVSDLLRGHTDR